MSIFSDLNEVQLLGNVVREPEIKYTPSGLTIAKLSLATNSSFKSGDEWKTKVEYHNLVAWSKIAENVQKRVTKGTRILVKGTLKTDTWEKDGIKRYSTSITVLDLILIDRYNKENTQKDNSDLIEGDFDEPIDPDTLPF